MDGLLILLAVLLLAVPVAVIVLIVAYFRLRGRLRVLEGVVQHLMQGTAAPAETPVQSPPKPVAAQPPATGPWDAASKTDPVASGTRTPDQTRDTEPPFPRGPTLFDRLTDWLRENWFYAVSALSLALAGVFLVQYGVEAGLLPPAVRVGAALAFGAALIGAGEWIRKRYGDGEDASTAYLPSVFSGAGLVSLFGAVLAARLLYDLIGVELAFMGLVLIASGALVLGWLHGPLLAAVGVIGAMLAPLLVGGDATEVRWLFGYYLLVAALGMAVDALRRWAWVSGLTLGLGFSLLGLLALSPNVTLFAVAGFGTLALMAVAIPAWRLWPQHDGPTVSEAIWRGAGRPYVTTLLAAASVLAATGLIFVQANGGEAEFWLVAGALTLLAALLITWARGAEALEDLAAVPTAALLLLIVSPLAAWDVLDSFRADPLPEAAMPLQASVFLALAVLLSGLAAWRSLTRARYAAIWAGAAALVAPIAALLLEVFWQPAAVIGAYPWALHIAALAAMQVVLAERFARADGPDARLRLSLAMLSALSLIAFFCVVLLSDAALTVALVVTVLAAALLDRRFNLPIMTVFIALGTTAIGIRLIVDPGLDWAQTGPLPAVVLAYAGALAGFIAAYLALRDRAARLVAQTWLESAAWSTGGVLVSVLLYRWIAALRPSVPEDSHWALGLGAMVWIGLALAQLQRAEALAQLRRVRYGLAAGFALLGAGALLAALTETNPLLSADPATFVLGPPILNTLILAYLLPAVVLGLGLWRLRLTPASRLALAGVSLALTAFWAFMAIRHLWQGADGMALPRGFSQPELYSYTVALLIVGALVFYQSIAKRSDLMRKAGLAVIGLAVAKVFLVDISGLDGLVRVFSLLALGLVLAGLAWLNRWAKGRAEATPD